MKRILLGIGLAATMLLTVLTVYSAVATPSENIYSLKIENINKNGADIYWSTSVETKGSVEYGATKLAELYNPQLPGNQASVIVTAIPALTKSEDYYVKAHHVKLDRLDMNYDPFVQYTITSKTPSGEAYTLSGEFVLVDTGVILWWQSWQFAIAHSS